MTTKDTSQRGYGTRGLVWAFLGLLVLTASTFGLSFLSLGAFEVPVAVGIAVIKSLVVAFVFMRLLDEPASHRIAGATAVIFVCILAALVSSDILTRGGAP